MQYAGCCCVSILLVMKLAFLRGLAVYPRLHCSDVHISVRIRYSLLSCLFPELPSIGTELAVGEISLITGKYG